MKLNIFIILFSLWSCKENPAYVQGAERTSFMSSPSIEYGISFTPSGDTVYFVKATGKWGKGNSKSTVHYAIRNEGSWSEPHVASFSGEYSDSDPHLTRDGQRLFFISKRPPYNSTDIWVVDKNASGEWSEPMRLPDINSDHSEYSPVTDSKGNLYFASNRPGGLGQGDLYVSYFQSDTFSTPLNMGSILNSEQGEWNLTISKDSIIIFESSGRKEGLSSYGDLYVSFLRDNQWTIPHNMTEINTTGSDLYPYLDEKSDILYFSSSDSLSNLDVNIYSIYVGTLLRKYSSNL